MTQLPSHNRDTTDFINKIRRLAAQPSNSLLVTFDVSSLYTNIPHNEGIRASEEDSNSRESLAPTTADLCHLFQSVYQGTCLYLMTLIIYQFMLLPWVHLWLLHMLICFEGS